MNFASQIPLGWVYLPVAFALGGLHALEPGHGKSLASAYLIGGRHNWVSALVLGASTTLSHTTVVILLAVASLGLRGYFPQNVLEHWIAVAGAAALLAVGSWVIFNAVRDLRHGHSHGHSHGAGHGHDDEDHGRGYLGIALVGLSNGALPCPGALAALLVAISVGRASMGLITVLVYSLGLAAALTAVGIVAVEAGKRAKSWLPSDAALLWLPLCSGVLVVCTGAWLLLAH